MIGLPTLGPRGNLCPPRVGVDAAPTIQDMNEVKPVHDSGLHLLTLVTTCATFVLIIAGGLVTSNDAGLSVPDWPLSHGSLWPEMRGGVFYEHTHRMLGAAVGLLIIVLNLWLWRKESRSWVKYLGLVALMVVISQGVLGGITVLFFLPAPVSIAHAGLAQVFFCLTVTLVLVTSVGWIETDQSLQFRVSERVDVLAALTTLVIFLQVIAGAILRHLGTVEGTKGAILVTWVLVIHLIGTLLVAGMIVYTALAILKRPEDRGLVGWAYLMLGLLVLQLFLGLGAYLARVEAVNQVQPLRLNLLITTSHLAVGALLLATSLVVALKLTRKSTASDEMPRWSEASLIC